MVFLPSGAILRSRPQGRGLFVRTNALLRIWHFYRVRRAGGLLRVTDSGGHPEVRPVVETEMVLGPVRKRILLTLAESVNSAESVAA